MIYLASPNTPKTAALLGGRNVLFSFPCWRSTVEQFLPTFGRIILDSGAFSEMNSGRVVDLDAYADWVAWIEDRGRVVGVAGLDDIRGDWRKSLRNYEKFERGFPTFHPGSDPDELLDDLIDIAFARDGWIGLGVVPPRSRWEDEIRRALERIPPRLYVHGFALGRFYRTMPRLDSVDSTNWIGRMVEMKRMCSWPITDAQGLQMACWYYEHKEISRPKIAEAQASFGFGGSDE